ncbi:MAG: hypothetical protein J6I85_04630 [Clostridia bacterium]|nr:hypothetical protein [Clostridia bacterium]
MEKKIYKVICQRNYMETGEITAEVKVFLDKTLALKYLKQQIEYIKQDVEYEDMEDYCEYESDMAYERYLDGRAFEDGVSIWLEEDTLCEHLDLDNNKEKEYEY